MNTGYRHFSTASLGVALATFAAMKAYAVDTYTWQAVDGVWDGNVTDRAHWACS